MPAIDIFQLGRTLSEKYPELAHADAPAVDLAIEDLAHASEELHRIVTALGHLDSGDYDGLMQVLTDLQDLFAHTSDHIHEAVPELEKLLAAASETTASLVAQIQR